MDKIQIRQQEIQDNEIARLNLLTEIDGLHKALGLLYLDNKLKAMQPLIPQLTRRWDEFNRLLIKLDNLHAEPIDKGKTPKLAPFDYTRLADEYY